MRAIKSVGSTHAIAPPCILSTLLTQSHAAFIQYSDVPAHVVAVGVCTGLWPIKNSWFTAHVMRTRYGIQMDAIVRGSYQFHQQRNQRRALLEPGILSFCTLLLSCLQQRMVKHGLEGTLYFRGDMVCHRAHTSAPSAVNSRKWAGCVTWANDTPLAIPNIHHHCPR